MCGIVGYIGNKNTKEILLEGLKELEYRGYDSAGIAVLQGENFESFKAVGKLVNLEEKTKKFCHAEFCCRHRSYKMGDAWKTDGAQCASASG